MAIGKDSTLWMINDSGNEDVLYQVDLSGKLIKELKVKNAKNKDWEDLSRDTKGNLYISDLGNNANKRTDLVIYKTPNPDKEKGSKITAEKIELRYPDQKKFPPKKKNLKFDSEAIFHFGNQVYILNKNRSNPFSGDVTIYSVPDVPGKYIAKLLATIDTCEESDSCRITAADISEDGKTLVLLSYGKVMVYTGLVLPNFTFEEVKTIDLKSNTQLESILIINEKTLLLSDEQTGKKGRNLYSLKL